MDSQPGSYALILRSKRHTRIEVGRLGSLETQPGYYVYLGSAFGPGGVRARVFRHSLQNKPLHWHVDYLRQVTEFHAAWYSQDPRKLEHAWAAVFSRHPGYSAIQGFGCSDCKCDSHLLFNPNLPDLSEFQRSTGQPVKIWIPGADT